MVDFLRRLKLGYILFNFFHKKELNHNVQIYRALGLKKKYYSPVSHNDFKGLENKNSIPDEYQMNENLKATTLFKKLTDQGQGSLLNFFSKGFASIQYYLSGDEVDAINMEIQRLVQSGKVKPLKNGKIMFAYKYSLVLKSLGNNAELKQLLSALLGDEALLFQSINFSGGSEQHTHSDSIHMTTFPSGGLLGVWFALEDITLENGPLHYYPGSHKLPYYLNEDYENEGSRWMLGKKSYSAYEEMIEEKIRIHEMKKEIFLAKKGDIFIWHANLFHGGEPHLNKSQTRKSMVLHYFRKGDVCYHEITQRPALIDYTG
jgi:hypothetical protein